VSGFVAVIEDLRWVPDALAVDCAVWAARDPASPSQAAQQARARAVQMIDAAITGLQGLRGQLLPAAGEAEL
jgi:hypothetical protein